MYSLFQLGVCLTHKKYISSIIMAIRRISMGGWRQHIDCIYHTCRHRLPPLFLPCFFFCVPRLLSGHTSEDRTWVFLPFTYFQRGFGRSSLSILQATLTSHDLTAQAPSGCQQSSVSHAPHSTWHWFCHFFLVCFFTQGLVCLWRVTFTLSFWPSCFYLSSARLLGLCDHPQLMWCWGLRSGLHMG